MIGVLGLGSAGTPSTSHFQAYWLLVQKASEPGFAFEGPFLGSMLELPERFVFWLLRV